MWNVSKGMLTTALAFALTGSVACSPDRSIEEQVGDGAITSRITAKLAADPEVNPFEIDVDTLDGVVTLRGEVDDRGASQEAEKHARATEGVVDVHNQIRVVPAGLAHEEIGSDTWITTKVKAKLTADPQLNPFEIDVDTLDGVVTLSGWVESEADRQEAEKLARDTEGVLAVQNELEVDAEEGAE